MDEIQEACDCPIDCIVNCTVKVHKRMKSIVRIVHPPSVVQSEFNEATRKLFLRKENKTMSLFNNSSPLVQRSAIFENIRWTQAAYALLCQPHTGRWTIWRCFLYFYGPWQCNLLCSQWDSHKPPSFHPKYLKLCSEDEQSFYGFGTTWG